MTISAASLPLRRAGRSDGPGGGGPRITGAVDPPLDGAAAGRGVLRWRLLAVLVGGVAFGARLVPVLRGRGLFGLGNYDDGVYFAAAVGLAQGRVPYRDFLLLHPPGIVIVLWPFALLGRVVGDADAFAVARVAFMLLGAANAVLVARLLREVSTAATVVGGLCYAVAYPAVFIAHSTLLETPETTCLLLALALLRRSAGRQRPADPWWAGVLLGMSAGVKIWGVLVLAAVLVWTLPTIGVRRSLRLALGGLVGATAVCLPFLVAAGPPMWRMVVLDQMARGGADAPLTTRVSDLLGLAVWQVGPTAWTTPTLVALVLALACVVPAGRSTLGRLAVVLLAATTALLLNVPSWYVHYAGLAVAPLALVVGAAVGAVVPDGATWRRRSVAAVALVVLAGWGLPGVTTTFGTAFPAAQLRPAVAAASGCVSADDPTTLVELGVLSRNLDRGCPLVIDVSGYSYDLRTPGEPRLTRRENAAWQARALDYLDSGTLTLVVRLSYAYALTARSARVVDAWPVVAQADGFSVRRP